MDEQNFQAQQVQNKNMKPCPSCGNMISKKAKACPACGAKIKKPVYKRAFGTAWRRHREGGHYGDKPHG